MKPDGPGKSLGRCKLCRKIVAMRITGKRFDIVGLICKHCYQRNMRRIRAGRKPLRYPIKKRKK